MQTVLPFGPAAAGPLLTSETPPGPDARGTAPGTVPDAIRTSRARHRPGRRCRAPRTENSHARPQPLLVISMSPFRLFGPPPEPEPAVAAPDNSGGVTWAPGAWAHDPAPATRHARPVGLDTRSAADRGRNATPSASGHRSAPSAVDDPPTDPFGFPPIPADPAPAWSAPVRPRPHLPVEPPLDPREAAASRRCLRRGLPVVGRRRSRAARPGPGRPSGRPRRRSGAARLGRDGQAAGGVRPAGCGPPGRGRPGAGGRPGARHAAPGRGRPHVRRTRTRARPGGPGGACRGTGADRARMGGLRVVLGPADRARRAGGRPAGGRRPRGDPARRGSRGRRSRRR